MIVPGRIVVIDNNQDDVRPLLYELNTNGEFASFLNPEEDAANAEKMGSLCRLIIADYFLFENDEANSLRILAQTLATISKTSKFFGLVIWTIEKSVMDDAVQNIKHTYREETHSELSPAFFEVLSKEEVNYSELVKRIQSFISNTPRLGVFYSAERSLNGARDELLNDLLPEGIMGALVKVLNRDFGPGTAREMLMLFVRMLTRKLRPEEELSHMITRLMQGRETLGFGKIHSLRSYYGVGIEEPLWTGDVITLPGTAWFIVTTPACDFSTKSVQHISLLRAFPITDNEFQGQTDEQLAMLLTNKGCNVQEAGQLKLRILRNQDLPDRLYSLQFVPYGTTHCHLLLDFESKYSVPRTQMSRLKQGRIVRIDHPIVDDLLYRLASFSSRVGVPPMPRDMTV